MTRPIPPEVLIRMREHERWLDTFREEGHQFAQQGVDLRDLDLSGRDLSTTALSHVCLDRAILYGADLSHAILYEGSFVQAVMDEAQLIEADATRSNFSGASLRKVQGLSAELIARGMVGSLLRFTMHILDNRLLQCLEKSKGEVVWMSMRFTLIS